MMGNPHQHAGNSMPTAVMPTPPPYMGTHHTTGVPPQQPQLAPGGFPPPPPPPRPPSGQFMPAVLSVPNQQQPPVFVSPAGQQPPQQSPGSGGPQLVLVSNNQPFGSMPQHSGPLLVVSNNGPGQSTSGPSTPTSPSSLAASNPQMSTTPPSFPHFIAVNAAGAFPVQPPPAAVQPVSAPIHSQFPMSPSPGNTSVSLSPPSKLMFYPLQNVVAQGLPDRQRFHPVSIDGVCKENLSRGCRHGSSCVFVHLPEVYRPFPDQLCRDFARGGGSQCRRPKCRFFHGNAEELEQAVQYIRSLGIPQRSIFVQYHSQRGLTSLEQRSPSSPDTPPENKDSMSVFPGMVSPATGPANSGDILSASFHSSQSGKAQVSPPVLVLSPQPTNLPPASNVMTMYLMFRDVQSDPHTVEM